LLCASYVRNARIPEHDIKASGLCPRRPKAGRLEPLVKACGVEVIVTDELPTYNLVAQAAAFGRAGPLPGAEPPSAAPALWAGCGYGG
jgi:hypothetical protein